VGVLAGALAGCGGGSSTKGGLGTTFKEKADGVPLKVTLSRAAAGGDFTARFTDTGSQGIDLRSSVLVGVGSDGTWSFPAVWQLPQQAANGYDVGPGQTVAATVGFSGTVSKVLFYGGGFTADASGAPIHNSSLAAATWTVGD
jgi:hypothetical protein